MGKKRLAFTLYVNEDGFLLSRNFRLQVVGDINWMLNNYQFNDCASSIDELFIINTSADKSSWNNICSNIQKIMHNCFIPITLGGGIRSLECADFLFGIGADKVTVNWSLLKNQDLIHQIAYKYGKQSVVASIDYRKKDQNYQARVQLSEDKYEFIDIDKFLVKLPLDHIGEFLLTSIDRDGTGQGLDTDIVDKFKMLKKPIILSGGAGTASHLADALAQDAINAVSTANLYNFIGSALGEARQHLIEKGIKLAIWNITNNHTR